MLIVRDIFTAKPGQASKLAKLFKRAFGDMPGHRVLTDLVAGYNTVIMEMEVESLAAWEEEMRKYMSGEQSIPEDIAAEMQNYTELWQSGRREVLRVWE